MLPEIAGVPDELLRLFSARQLHVETALTQLAETYTATHGHSPDRAALARLAQQATLEDRPAPTHRRYGEQLRLWSEQAAGVFGCQPDQIAEMLTRRCLGRPGPLAAFPDRRLSAHTDATVARLIETGATWSRWDIRRHASAQLREHGYRADPPAVTRLTDEVLARPDVFAIGPPEPADTPTFLRRADGTTRFARRGEDRYSSQLVAQAEADLVTLAAARYLPPAERARRATALYGDIDDDVLIARHASGRRQLDTLSARRHRSTEMQDVEDPTATRANQPPKQPVTVSILDAKIAEEHAALTAIEREVRPATDATAAAASSRMLALWVSIKPPRWSAWPIGRGPSTLWSDRPGPARPRHCEPWWPSGTTTTMR